MINCPVCKRAEIVGERVDHESIFSDVNQYDCPACGCFRIEASAASQVQGLEPDQAERLALWIGERNEEGDIPFVKGA